MKSLRITMRDLKSQLYVASRDWRIRLLLLGTIVIGFDIPIIQKFYPWFTWPSIVCDTLLLSRLLNPNLLDIDQKRQWRYMPLQLYGRHSLEAYGHRLGEYKGGFSKDTDWKDWSQEMEDYCIQDVNVTTKLCSRFINRLNGLS
jgi:hypothetical protein